MGKKNSAKSDENAPPRRSKRLQQKKAELYNSSKIDDDDNDKTEFLSLDSESGRNRFNLLDASRERSVDANILGESMKEMTSEIANLKTNFASAITSAFATEFAKLTNAIAALAPATNVVVNSEDSSMNAAKNMTQSTNATGGVQLSNDWTEAAWPPSQLKPGMSDASSLAMINGQNLEVVTAATRASKSLPPFGFGGEAAAVVASATSASKSLPPFGFGGEAAAVVASATSTLKSLPPYGFGGEAAAVVASATNASYSWPPNTTCSEIEAVSKPNTIFMSAPSSTHVNDRAAMLMPSITSHALPPNDFGGKAAAVVSSMKPPPPTLSTAVDKGAYNAFVVNAAINSGAASGMGYKPVQPTTAPLAGAAANAAANAVCANTQSLSAFPLSSNSGAAEMQMYGMHKYTGCIPKAVTKSSPMPATNISSGLNAMKQPIYQPEVSTSIDLTSVSPAYPPVAVSSTQVSGVPTSCMPSAGTNQSHAPPLQLPHELPQNAFSATYVQPSANVYTHKLYDLPKFSGQPEEWPLFYLNYVDSTNEFKYSNRQNLMRLHKCLTGEAKQAVTSMLIHPENVPRIINELEFRFGRPQLLLQAQLAKLKQFPPIAGNKIENVINFSTEIKNVVAFLEMTTCHSHLANPVLLEELATKLPVSYRLEWCRYTSLLPAEPTVADFSIWLDRLARDVSRLPAPPTKSSAQQPSTKQLLHVKEAEQKKTECVHCQGNHFLVKCKKFSDMPTSDKWDFVKSKHLCFACLRKGHSSFKCKYKRACGINDCKKIHNELLHELVVQEATAPVLNCRSLSGTSNLLFKVLPVRLRGPNGSMETYAMFDDGAALTLIDNAIASRLGLKGPSQPLSLQWVGEKTHTEPSRRVDVEIEGIDEAHRFLLRDVRTVGNMKLPSQSFDKNDFAHLNHLPLQSYNNATPVLLIGLDNVKLLTSTVEANTEMPIAMNTKLGWIAFGPANEDASKTAFVFHVTVMPDNLNEIVHDYICMDSLGTKVPSEPIESDEDKHAKMLLKNNTKRVNKSFETSLLWKEEFSELPNSYPIAEQRLLIIERKMEKDPTFASKYGEAINNYLVKGYARKLDNVEIQDNTHPIWYLPHFAVENINKPGKIRVVFDAAAKINDCSLNSFLLKGPERAKPLLNILFRFRQGLIAAAADIKEMFLQIKICDADQQAQRFLWRDENKKIQHFAMTSMIFGTVCSPCCAEYVKNLNAMEFYSESPDAALAIVNNHYVDDFVMSFQNEKEATAICTEVTRINAEGGFTLRNFASNSSSLLSIMNAEEQQNVLNMERQATYDKILGMFWNTASDNFEFKTTFARIPDEVITGVRIPTKRELLGILMSIFDPFGLVADFLLHAKMLVQHTWKQQIGWDDPIPPMIHKKWKAWWQQLERIADFKISRCHSPNLLRADVQLHVFVDASQEAFAAAAYFRIELDGNIDVSFVCGKTRTAPLKLTSIPRLELQAAVLGTRISQLVIENHDVEISSITFWSDSRTVLCWINSPLRRYKQYVGHRIAEILSSTKASQWQWVPSDKNVADVATRSTSAAVFSSDNRWLKGPDFLKSPESEWPTLDSDSGQTMAEEEILPEPILHSQVSELVIDFSRFSNFLKLKRTMARIFRAADNFLAVCRHKQRQPIDEPLSANECRRAELFICKLTQQDEFADEIIALKTGKQLNKSSQIYALCPSMDEDGLVRASGRLDAALCLPFSARRPILLPSNHYVTKLVVRYFHELYHHQNTAVMINECRQRFWIPQAKAKFKMVQKECLTCQHDRGQPYQPRMGPLPEDRVTPFVRPFTYTGVDLFGPFTVTIGRRHEKRWAAIFTCLTVRAVHIELVENLSTDAFILCLNNFINRRGKPIRLRSDCGTNFIGAQREISRINRSIDPDQLVDEASKLDIEWLFNCPANPSSGGCWERLIRVVKNLLAKTLAEVAPRIETLRAALIEAENIINSRPLTDIPLEFEDDDPLTPNHFIGCVPTSTQTPYAAAEEQICLRKQWLIAQNLKACLWKRWVRDYLPQLMHRNKWHETSASLMVDDLVLVIDANHPRGKWPKGRVTKTFPAKDGQTRFVELQTATGTIRRPINKLVKLNIKETSE